MNTALITGSTKGIGECIGIDLLNKNYTVYFNYAKDDKSAKLLNSQLKERGFINFKIIKADLSTYKGVEKLIKETGTSKLDVLVLNAAITDKTKFGEIELEKWNKVVNVNLTMPFFLIQKLNSEGKIKPNGRIIFISAILAKVPHATSISYSITKAGANALVKNLVKYFSKKKITVNAVAPGFVKTTWHKTKTLDHIKRIRRKIALNRFAESEEVSSLVMEIIKNSYIDGQIFTIDGGYNYGEV